MDDKPEFGEELREFREDLAKLLQGSVEKFFENSESFPVVLPGDLSFIYDIEKEEIYCVLSEAMIEVNKIEATLLSLDGRQSYSDCFFYYNVNKKDKLDKMQGLCKAFLDKLIDSKIAPYLK